MKVLAEQVIVNVIRKQMNLPENNVFISNQNKTIPNDKQLYISVGMVDSQVMSNTKSIVKDGDTTTNVIQQVQMRQNIQIDVMSASNLALLRYHEILFALYSIYCEQQQEENEFKIFHIPTTFVNSSSAEGGSQINRFSIVISCFVWYRKDIDLVNADGDYYDDFDTRIDDEETIGTATGLIEFNITVE